MNDIESRIREFLATNILFSDNGFPYPDDTSFLQSGLIDSMGVMELVTYVAEEFRIDVSPEEVTAENFDSVAHLSAYVRRKSNGAQSCAA